MAQVDAFRFLRNVTRLFAPAITEGQVFIAYIDEDNSFSVQAENILKTSDNQGNSIDNAQVQELAQRISDIQTQANQLETLCNQIPAINVAISELTDSGISPSDPVAVSEFDATQLRSDLTLVYSMLEPRIHVLEADLVEFQTLKGELEELKYELEERLGY